MRAVGTKEKYYSTIQSVAYRGALHVIARGYEGMDHFWFGGTSWERLATDNPSLSDQAGWGDPRHYKTIQAVAVKDRLYLASRDVNGLRLYEWDEKSKSWKRAAVPVLNYSDAKGWARPEYYETIQAVENSGHLYIVAHARDGV